METPILRTKKIGTLIEGTSYKYQNLAFLCWEEVEAQYNKQEILDTGN